MIAKIYVTLKKSVLDPQGEAVLHALHSLNYPMIKSVRQGKYFEIILEDISETEAKKAIHEICEKLLANTVMEDFHFEIAGLTP